jgi:hypothetical protein
MKIDFIYSNKKVMRKIAFIIVVALLSSCDRTYVPKGEVYNIDGNRNIQVIKFEGHEYISYSRSHGGSLCHSESCDCKKIKE